MSLLSDLLRFDISEDNLQVRREQVRARIASYPTMVVPPMFMVPLMMWLMWDMISHDTLLAWMVFAFAVQTFEMSQWWRFRNAAFSLKECRLWNRRFKINTILGASVWGVAWLLMYLPGNLAYQIIIICVAMGFATGGVTINPVHRPSLFLYLIFLLVPLIARLAMDNDKQHWFLALMLVVFIVFMLNAAMRLMYTFELSLRQRFEKEGLLRELRQREADIAEALEQAEAASRAKSKFLATASHDLRQPLQALRLFTEALQETTKEKEPVRLAGQIGKSVDALVDMFDDLLDVSRLDAGIVEPRWQHFALEPLMDRLYGDFAPIAQTKGLSFDMPNVGDKCKGTDCGAVVCSDPFLLERMLRNLISNAIRYTDSGGVSVRRTCSDDKVMLEVVDSGIGIKPESLPHIFDEYYQVGNPHRDRRKGLGLGLTIVRRIDQLLSSGLQVSSEPGVSSTFSFSVTKGDATQLEQPFVIPHSEYDLSGRVVAFVEDDPDIRESTAELMRQWGCKVFTSESADEVMRELDVAGQRPDVLVCDYRLPQGMTAIHVIQRMRELWGAELPAVVLTGDTATETLHAIHASGAILLHKPIAPIRLRAMMYFVLTGKH
ncbi:MAG: hybrid sensor histidine kinase/response regulator [Gammaproteobacteria bacterium]|nr:hybrid sensor histidine kinase/response regulator [Gammaproteobacteria bacterium]MBU1447213.1 hybrid sensor histidine kinase/response regulator [Gammaproteobacteria bacterium]